MLAMKKFVALSLIATVLAGTALAAEGAIPHGFGTWIRCT
jgi:hypothetical protein